MESVGGFGQLVDLIPYQLPPVPSYREDTEVLFRPNLIEDIVEPSSNESEDPTEPMVMDITTIPAITITEVPLNSNDVDISGATEWDPVVTTSTTVIFTPGNNKMEEAMAVKEVADQLLMASGTVIGITAGIFVTARTGKPMSIIKGATAGKEGGEMVGNWMWGIING